MHEAAQAPASEPALAGWLAGEGRAGAIAELNWGWAGLGWVRRRRANTPSACPAPKR